MKLPKVGQKIKVIRPWWYDPMGEIPNGETGVVVLVSKRLTRANTAIHIKMDKPQKNLEDNIMAFYPECGLQYCTDKNHLGGPVKQFYYHCEIVPD